MKCLIFVTLTVFVTGAGDSANANCVDFIMGLQGHHGYNLPDGAKTRAVLTIDQWGIAYHRYLKTKPGKRNPTDAELNGYFCNQEQNFVPNFKMTNVFDDYSNTEYHIINGYLRTGDASLKFESQIIEAMDTVINAVPPIPFPLILFRGETYDDGTVPHFHVGDKIKELAYTSTTLNSDIAQHFVAPPNSIGQVSVVYKIRTHANVKGYFFPWIRGLQDLAGREDGSQESKLLLARGSIVEIKAISFKVVRGRKYIYLDCSLIQPE